MIATSTNHVSKGVQNYNDMTKFTWFKTNFNMPVGNYMSSNNPFTRYEGCWNYITKTTSYSLSGFSPGFEICNGCAIFDFENNSGSNYNINTNLYVAWRDPSLNVIFWVIYDYNFSSTLAPYYYTEVWFGGNTGCAGWEVATAGSYHFRSSASGTPNISVVDTTVNMSNVPSTSVVGTSGYIWVEGTNLCYINANGWKHSMTGTYVGGPVGPVSKGGSIWIDNSNNLHWVSSTCYDYKCAWKVRQFASFYGNGPTNTVYAGTSHAGSLWVDDEFGSTHLSYIGADGYKYLTGAGNNPYA
jgi:hypothetical protein